ncbi:hypothetical protein JOC75_004425 [Metabacillus crassostreae]|nr:hypothetical protein [Metabacillus crassostreae]
MLNLILAVMIKDTMNLILVQMFNSISIILDLPPCCN